jgi:membrane protease YdiL (CAAX protease family)
MVCVVIGQEVLFRELFMNYLANKFGSTTKAWMAAIAVSSIIFGLGHFWGSHHGMMSSTIGA